MASIQERVQADLERGDYGLARQRLASYLGTAGYDAELVTKLGQISHDMHDLYQAGRYWIVAPVDDVSAEKAIAIFLDRAGRTPEEIVGQLPRSHRTTELKTYPELVRDRLRKLNLHKAIVKRPREEVPSSTTWKDRAAMAGFLLMVLIVLTVCARVLNRIFEWLFGD